MVAYTIDTGNYSTHMEYKKVCMTDAIVIFFKVFHIIVAVADLSFRIASLHHTTFSSVVYTYTHHTPPPKGSHTGLSTTWVLPRYLVFPTVQALLRSPLPPVSSPCLVDIELNPSTLTVLPVSLC